jgi:LppX_LprAFG lipoprotein
MLKEPLEFSAMTSRRLVAVVMALTGVCATACTSSKGNGTPGASMTSGSTAASTSAAPSAAASDAAKLATRMQNAVRSVSSAHLSLNVSAAGQQVRGAGDETLRDGKLTALDLTEQIDEDITLRLRIIGTTLYVQVPPAINRTGKPWLRVSPNSSEPLLKQLSSSVISAQQYAELDSFRHFVTAAKSVKLAGHDTMDGRRTDHYSIVVDVRKLASQNPNSEALAQSGVSTVPVELWLDQRGRPVRLTEKLAVQGQQISVLITLGNYDAPVTISPPPADQIGSA